MVEGPRQLLDPGRVVDEERAVPCLAAVRAAEHAALIALLMNVALGRDHHDVGVGRIDEDGRDLLCEIEAKVRPGAPGIGGLVDADPLVDRAAGDHVARADVDHVRIRRRHLDGADRRHVLDRIEDRVPGLPRAGGLPDAGGGKTDVERARLADRARHSGHASCAERSHVAPLQSREQLGTEGLRGAQHEQDHRREGSTENKGGRCEALQHGRVSLRGFDAAA
jgi:hypothetical protein